MDKDLDAVDAVARQANIKNKQVILKICYPFTAYLSEKYNTQVTDAKDLDVATSIHKLMEHRDNYVKIFGRFFHYCTDQPADNPRDSNSLKI